ncbi:MAG: hypothetical protein ABL930_11325 [Pseudobdellovibrio sp.]
MIKALAHAYQQNNNSGFGVLWNGGGAIGSRTVDNLAYEELNEFLNIYLRDLGAANNKFITFGGSRGGVTALNLASHPSVTAIRVAFAYSSVPPNEISEYGSYTCTTVPLLLYGSDWSTGFFGSWRKSFIHPSGYGKSDFAGLDGLSSHLKALTGTSNFQEVAANFNTLTSAKINKLVSNRTQIFLEMASHDYIVPSIDQFK